MIPPTIGRIVLVHLGNGAVQWHPATISYVHSSECIAVAGFDSDGEKFVEHSIELRQGVVATDPVFVPNALMDQRFACWMPYQRQQAEKHAPFPDPYAS